MINIARIKDGVVINIEVADQDWLDSTTVEDGCILVPYTAEQPANIGLGWSPEDGFEQPLPALPIDGVPSEGEGAL